MRQTGKYLKRRIRELRRLHRIIRSVYHHRKTYLKGMGYLGKSLKNHRIFRI